MLGLSKNWKRFWEKQTLPLHAKDSAKFYAAYCSELLLLLAEAEYDRVLEIGCGNGALFKHLGFDQVRKYCGVDVSSRMIAEFEKTFPRTDLKVHDGQSYRSKEEYDLVFSSGLVQYFHPRMLRQHLENAIGMLAPGGRIVCGAVPWRIARYAFRSGHLTGSPHAGVIQLAKSFVNRLKEDRMGRWYHHREFRRIARRLGLVVTFHGSIHYPYRFHVVLQRPHAEAPSHGISQAA